MVTKSKKARPITPATFQPLFAVVLTIDGKRQVVSAVGYRDEVQAIAADLNRDSWASGYRATVRPAVVRVTK
jgi:hypothetical protein